MKSPYYPWFGMPMPMFNQEPRRRHRSRDHRPPPHIVDELQYALEQRDKLDNFIKDLVKKKEDKDKEKKKNPFAFSTLEWVLILFIMSPFIAKGQKLLGF